MRKKGIITVTLAMLLTFSSGIGTVVADATSASTDATTATIAVTTALPTETTTATQPTGTTTATQPTETTTATQPAETTTAKLEETTTAQPAETTTVQPEETTTVQPEETTTAQPEETAPAGPTADEITPSVDKAMEAVAKFIKKNDTNPDAESSWFVIGAVRSGIKVPTKYKNAYYKNVLSYLVKNDWVITKSKYSEYSKLIIGLTAIGKDARDIAGHNMLSYLSDFTNVKRQGFNGTVWALLALNCHDSYEIPKNPDAKEQATEEGLIQAILKAELSAGGWALYGAEPDADMTGMTIQALSSYYGKREDVTAAIDRAVEWLSSAQLASGGYQTIGTETAESVAQVITALSSVGVDCGKDDRFIKNGKWPMTGLMQYYLKNGSFAHSADGGYNGLATAQSMYALVSYKRMLNGESFLYHMSDISLKPGKMPKTLNLDEEKKKETDKIEDSEQVKATGETKTLGKLQLAGSKKANKNTSAKKTSTKTEETKNTENTIVENEGWSFEGAEYVPETIETGSEEVKEPEESVGIAAYFPEDMTAEGYMAVGAGSVLLLEAATWALYKLIKSKKKAAPSGGAKS